jgi:hypothetical protein
MKVLTAVVLIVVVALGGYFLSNRTEDNAVPHAAGARSRNEVALNARSKAESATTSVSPSGPLVPAGETDALEQVSRLLAKGNPSSADDQYRLYELLSGCAVGYDSYFSGKTSRLSKEEAAMRAEALRTADDDATDIYQFCHRLIEERAELTTTAGDWLEKALAQNHPRAQTARATQLINALALANPAVGRTAPANAERDARQLLANAIASGDGQVLWTLAEHRSMLGGTAEEAGKDRWAMMLASCDRGVDCSPEAQWVKRYCKADPATLCPINANAEEMIRSKTGSDFEMIKMRAQEINALIDAGNGAQLVPPP